MCVSVCVCVCVCGKSQGHNMGSWWEVRTAGEDMDGNGVVGNWAKVQSLILNQEDVLCIYRKTYYVDTDMVWMDILILISYSKSTVISTSKVILRVNCISNGHLCR